MLTMQLLAMLTMHLLVMLTMQSTLATHLSIAVNIMLCKCPRLCELIHKDPFRTLAQLNMHAFVTGERSSEPSVIYDSKIPVRRF